MTPEHLSNRELVARYRAGGPVPAQAIAGLTRDDLLAFPVRGTWSIQQIIIHLMDSDLIAADRMKRVIAEERPTLLGYNETAFAQRLFPERLDVTMACDVFHKNRLMTAEILSHLPEEAFSRVGLHNERGEVSLRHFVESYSDHLDHHLKFIYEKRRLLGKPL